MVDWHKVEQYLLLTPSLNKLELVWSENKNVRLNRLSGSILVEKCLK